jgi:hypothetical protein
MKEEDPMKKGIGRWILAVGAFLVSVGVAMAQQSSSTASSSTGVKVNPAAVQQKAGSPPPASATKTSSVGDHVKMSTPPDSASWEEQIDADGNGTVDRATLVWDSKDRVLLSNTQGSFTCMNGATGTGELLISVNGAGNPRGRPAGSGFWLASLDKGQCGAQTNSLWGCKFDASGNATACGIAQLDQANDDLTIVSAQQ